MNLSRFSQSDKGYTLTELMVVVSLIAIMTGVGYSGFSSWQKRERLNSITYQFSDYLKEARMLAIEKRTSYSVSFIADQYTIFVDFNGDGVLDVDQGETIVHQVNVAQREPGITITVPSGYALVYNIRGMPAAFSNATITFSNAGGSSCDVKISTLGRVSVDTSGNN